MTIGVLSVVASILFIFASISTHKIGESNHVSSALFIIGMNMSTVGITIIMLAWLYPR